MIRTKVGLAGLFAAWALGLMIGPSAQADPIQATYTTTGSIGTTGITGTPDVSFQGVSDGTLMTGQPFSLGQFIVTPPADGVNPTYQTPFQITITVTNSEGDPALPKSTPITLNGDIMTYFNFGGPGKSSLQAGFDFTGVPTVGEPPQDALTHWIFESGNIAYGLYPTSSLIALDPSGQNEGSSDVKAELDVYNVPEPTSIALFFASGVFLLARRLFSTGDSRAKSNGLN